MIFTQIYHYIIVPNSGTVKAKKLKFCQNGVDKFDEISALMVSTELGTMKYLGEYHFFSPQSLDGGQTQCTVQYIRTCNTQRR